MRWLIPVAVVVIALGILMLYLPLGKGAVMILPPQTPFALMLAGIVGLVVGVTSTWLSPRRPVDGGAPTGRTQVRNATMREGSRVGDAVALAGLVIALAALGAVTVAFVVQPILISLQGPDPCGPSKFLPNNQAGITACFAEHPDYYHFDPAADSYSTPASRLSQSLIVVGVAALPLGLCAALISWLALAVRTGRRRTALLGVTLGSLVVVGLVVLYVGSLLGGGGE